MINISVKGKIVTVLTKKESVALLIVAMAFASMVFVMAIVHIALRERIVRHQLAVQGIVLSTCDHSCDICK